MSIRHILRPARRPRHTTPGSALVVLALLALATACAPRQARVESEPNPGAPTPAAGDAEVQATLRADLRTLAGAQEGYFADNGYYASRLVDLDVTASSGVRLDVIQGDRRGWSAVASADGDECAMYAGDVRSPRGYLTEAGRAACR